MYKIIKNNAIIDIVKTPYFVRFLPSGYIALTDKASAQGIVGSDGKTAYSFKPVDNHKIAVVRIEEITEEEFNRLQSLLNSDQELCADESVLKQVRDRILTRLSNICKNKIKDGFNIILSDNKSYHFDLTAEDQLNLLALENQLNSGATTFIYHAANQPCQVFKRADMSKIIKAFRQHILYHTTYFNVVKQYINMMTDIEKIELFAYGTDVSDVTTDPHIKQILIKGSKLS